MELWIRSQDKLSIKKVNYICINGTDIFCEDYLLGIYETEERALEVLDEIQSILRPVFILKNCKINKEVLETLNLPKDAIVLSAHDDGKITYTGEYVYEMPEE